MARMYDGVASMSMRGFSGEQRLRKFGQIYAGFTGNKRVATSLGHSVLTVIEYCVGT
jgi:hypothetical protein